MKTQIAWAIYDENGELLAVTLSRSDAREAKKLVGGKVQKVKVQAVK